MKAHATPQCSPALTQRLDDWISTHSMRRTPERATLLGVIETLRAPFSPAEVWEACKDVMTLSRGCVYGNLRLFTQAGLIAPVKDASGVGRRFRINSQPRREARMRIHMRCNNCGAVRSVYDPGLESYLRERRYAYFAPESPREGISPFSVLIEGLCSKCRRQSK